MILCLSLVVGLIWFEGICEALYSVLFGSLHQEDKQAGYVSHDKTYLVAHRHKQEGSVEGRGC